MAQLKLSAPWVVYYRELNELFKSDPRVAVIFDEETPEVKLYARNPEVAAALAKLLPVEKEFGNVTLKVTVIPANGTEKIFAAIHEEDEDRKDLIRTAFTGNDAISYIWDVASTIPGLDVTYVVFKNKVVQYFCDTMQDPHGLCSTLYENIARDIFGDIPGVFFCTDILYESGEE